MVGLNGIVQRISAMYKSSKWCDIEFHFDSDCSTGGPTVVYAHRLVLAPMSDVFEAMCYGSLAETTPVIVTDISADIFKAMLEYFYTDHLPIKSIEDAFQLLYVARKYLVEPISELARKYVVEKIGDEYCIDIYNYADLLDENLLKETALEHICRRIDFVLDYFTEDNTTDNLIMALANASKINCQEITLVKLAEMWAVNACTTRGLDITSENLRNILVQHKIFEAIQWSELSEDDLSSVREGLLSKDEIPKLPCATKRSQYQPRLICLFMTLLYDYRAHRDLPENSVITTSIKARTTVKLRGIMIHAKELTCDKLSFIAIRHVPQKYTERLEITVLRDGLELARIPFTKEVSYGEPFHVKWKEILLKQDIQYDIKIRMLSNRVNSPLHNFSTQSIQNVQGVSVTCDRTDWEGPINEPNNVFTFIDGFLCTY